MDTYGTIDILVNNAGICVLEDFDAPDYAVRDRHIDINIKGVWNVTHAVLPHMIEKKDGRIVVMSSVTGYMVADPGEAAYAMTKAALIGFTRAMAREVADHNIRVNAICPGYVRTPLVEGMAKQSDPENPERAIQAIADAVPLKRLAHPEEVGELAAFLASDESSYITGTQIVIDGAARCRRPRPWDSNIQEKERSRGPVLFYPVNDLSLNTSGSVAACKVVNVGAGYQVEVARDGVLESGSCHCKLQSCLHILAVHEAAD